MKNLGQRDTRWKNTKLGTSDTTIGNYGCTITALTMLAGLDRVDEVNSRLKAVGGFASGNLLIWSKINEALPWLKFVWRGYSYENDKVKAAIVQAGGCLVEVNGAPIGGTKHWVLYIGDGKMIDPWDGKEKSTTSYQSTGYATIENLGEAPESDTMEIDKETFEQLVTKATKYDEFVNAGFSEPQEIIDEIADLEKQVSDYAKKIEDQDKTIFTQKEDIRTLETDLAVTKIELSDCEGQIQEIPSLEEYTKGYKSTGRKTVEVYGNLTVETSFKKV